MKWLGWKHPTFDTPWGAILPSLVFCLCVISFEFHEILAIDNCFSSAAALLEFLAFWELRYRRPELFVSDSAPGAEDEKFLYKMPKYKLFLIPFAMVFCALVLYHSLTKSKYIFILNSCCFALGYPLGKYLEVRFKLRHGIGEGETSRERRGDEDSGGAVDTNTQSPPPQSDHIAQGQGASNGI